MYTFYLICVVSTLACSTLSVKGNDVSSRIYGGSSLNITDAPYMAIYHTYFIETGGWTYSYWTNDCGACIIHERFLVTAAHCHINDTHRKILKQFIKVGTDRFEGGVEYDIEKVFVHPQYDEIDDTPDYDIAVIKLKSKLILSNKVNIIKMAPKNNFIKFGEIVVTMGFGQTGLNTSKLSDILLSVKVPYVSCDDYKTLGPITNNVVCTGGTNKHACKGDSGGPLVYNNTLIGLVSFVPVCGKSPHITIYASISALRDFVEDTIKVHS